jgi:hypothetical protein
VACTCECCNETLGFHKMQENSRLAENRVDIQEGFCSGKYFSQFRIMF